MDRFAAFKWQALFADWRIFLEGLGRTASTAGLALLLSLALGVLFGILATSPWKAGRSVTRLYVSLIQNTPLVTQVFFLYYALPHFKLVLPTEIVGVLGLGFYHGAYMAEVVRAGIQAIHRGQLEAALSQGFTYPQAMRYVILPQATQVVLPPMTNQAVALIKNSSILAMISGGDLMFQADSWSASTGYYGPAYLTVWAIYFALCFPLAQTAKRWEDRVKRSRGGEVRAA